MSNRNVDALPRYVLCRWGWSVPDKFSLKQRASEAMRAAVRRELDAVRLGGDPLDVDAPTHTRDVCNRWRFS